MSYLISFLGKRFGGRKRPDSGLNKDKQVEFAADLKQSIATGEQRRSEDGEWVFTSHGVSASVIANAENTSYHLDGDEELYLPKGTVIGAMDFLPTVSTPLETSAANNIATIKDIFLQGARGLSQFFESIDEKREQGMLVPAVLYGVTNDRMAKFALERLGFYRIQRVQDNVLLMAATDTVRKKLEEGKPFLDRLEQRNENKEN